MKASKPKHRKGDATTEAGIFQAGNLVVFGAFLFIVAVIMLTVVVPWITGQSALPIKIIKCFTSPLINAGDCISLLFG